MPAPVTYLTDDTVGCVLSFTVMFRFAMAAIWLPDVSCTAPASMSSCGVIMAFTVPVFVLFKSNVM